jgi:hypothetical protein
VYRFYDASSLSTYYFFPVRRDVRYLMELLKDQEQVIVIAVIRPKLSE